jgi:hypothetical protein
MAVKAGEKRMAIAVGSEKRLSPPASSPLSKRWFPGKGSAHRLRDFSFNAVELKE